MHLSSYSQVNVYTLGKTYLKLSQELHINVPAIGEEGSTRTNIKHLFCVLFLCDSKQNCKNLMLAYQTPTGPQLGVGEC